MTLSLPPLPPAPPATQTLTWCPACGRHRWDLADGEHPGYHYTGNGGRCPGDPEVLTYVRETRWTP